MGVFFLAWEKHVTWLKLLFHFFGCGASCPCWHHSQTNERQISSSHRRAFCFFFSCAVQCMRRWSCIDTWTYEDSDCVVLYSVLTCKKLQNGFIISLLPDAFLWSLVLTATAQKSWHWSVECLIEAFMLRPEMWWVFFFIFYF